METNEVKQMTLQHTPLPWVAIEYVYEHEIQADNYYGGRSVLHKGSYTYANDNAAFIVEACNNYYSLRSQVEELKKQLEDSLLLYQNQVNTITELKKENERLREENEKMKKVIAWADRKHS